MPRSGNFLNLFLNMWYINYLTINTVVRIICGKADDVGSQWTKKYNSVPEMRMLRYTVGIKYKVSNAYTRDNLGVVLIVDKMIETEVVWVCIEERLSE